MKVFLWKTPTLSIESNARSPFKTDSSGVSLHSLVSPPVSLVRSPVVPLVAPLALELVSLERTSIARARSKHHLACHEFGGIKRRVQREFREERSPLNRSRSFVTLTSGRCLPMKYSVLAPCGHLGIGCHPLQHHDMSFLKSHHFYGFSRKSSYRRKATTAIGKHATSAKSCSRENS